MMQFRALAVVSGALGCQPVAGPRAPWQCKGRVHVQQPQFGNPQPRVASGCVHIGVRARPGGLGHA